MQKIRNILSNKFLSFLLLPVFFAWKGKNQIFPEISFLYASIVCLINMGFLALIAGLIRSILKTKTNQAFLLATTVSVPLLFFGPAHDFLKPLPIPRLLTSYTFLVPLLCSILLIYLYKNKNKQLLRWSLYLNSLLIIFLISEASKQIYLAFQQPETRLLDKRFEACREYTSTKKNTPPENLPDIYLLIFDEYASSPSLQQTLGFNNASFEEELKSKGFNIFPKSGSNYNLTLVSMSSILNMDYPDLSGISIKNQSEILYKASRSLGDNALFRILKENNYSITQAHALQFPEKPEINASYFSAMLYQHYLYQTLFGRLFRDCGYNLFSIPVFEKWNIGYNRFKCEELNGYFHQTDRLLKKTCTSDSLARPQFVYAHYTFPHEPHCINEEGKLRSMDSVSGKTLFNEGYLNQIRFANRYIANITEYIQYNNRQNTIIIIAGDHGFKSHSDENMPTHIFKNFFAIKDPLRKSEKWEQSISGVNIFRHILNDYMQANMSYLPGRTFRFTTEKLESR